MGARTIVTDEEVVAAGRALAVEGAKVTGWSLRRVVGRGDPTRLEAVWQERQQTESGVEGDAAPAAPSAVVLPPVVAEAVEAMRGRVGDLAADLWRAAERLAAERAQGEAEAARAEAAALRQELDQAAVALHAADAAREAAEDRLEVLGGRVAAVEAEAAKADQRVSVAEAVAAAAREDLRAALGAAVGAGQPKPEG